MAENCINYWTTFTYFRINGISLIARTISAIHANICWNMILYNFSLDTIHIDISNKKMLLILSSWKSPKNNQILQHCVTLNPSIAKKHLLLQTMKLYRGWLNVWKNWLTHIRCNEHFVQILMMLMRLWILWSFALSENSIYPIPTLQYFR